MPKIVDREARRAALLDAATRLLCQGGPDALTTRAIAIEAGEAKGALSHYFDGKSEIVLELLRHHHRHAGQRLIDALAANDGVEGLRLGMLAIMPVDEARFADAIVDVTFAAHAGADPALQDRYSRGRRRLTAILVDQLTRLEAEGRLQVGVSPADAAADLLTLMDGLSLRAVLVGLDNAATDVPAQLDRLLARLVRHDTSTPARPQIRR